MNIKPVVHYQFRDLKKTIIIFSSVLMALYALFLIIEYNFMRYFDNAQSQISGMDNTVAIFMMIVGICMVSESFAMFVQNGVSRKTMFTSTLVTMLLLSALMSVIETVLRGAAMLLSSGTNLTISSSLELYEMGADSFANLLLSAAYTFTVYLMLFAFGWLIGWFYYRAGKALKISISIGVPVFIFIGIPILVLLFSPSPTLLTSIMAFFDFCLGMSSNQPIRAMITFTCVAFLLYLLSYLFMRRSPLRPKR